MANAAGWPQRFLWQIWTHRAVEAISDSTFERLHDPAEPMHAFLSEYDGEIVSLAHCLFHRSTTRPHDVCHLQDLFTASQASPAAVECFGILGLRLLQAGRCTTSWRSTEAVASTRMSNKGADVTGLQSHHRWGVRTGIGARHNPP